MKTLISRGSALLVAAIVSFSLNAGGALASENVNVRNFVRAESDMQLKG